MAKLLATDESALKIEARLGAIAGYLGLIAGDNIDTVISDPTSLHRLIQSGLIGDVLSIGDQIVIPHEDYGDVAWDLIGVDHDEDASGLNDHTITLQTHAVIDKIVFDAAEAEVATESTFSSDYSYYVADSDSASGYTLLVVGTDYNVGDSLDSDTTYYHSAIEDSTGYIVKYGYNNWEHSAIRQWLNSEALAGAWWEAQHLGDVAPSYASTKNGFLYGFDEDFKALLGTTVKRTALNKITDGGGYVDLTEKIFLLSRTEVSGGNENSVAEGSVYDYYDRLVGSVTTDANTGRIKLYNGTAQWWGLRDPDTSNSYVVRGCITTGTILYSTAGSTDRGLAPACILM